jgi:WD40 repeat protein
MEETAQVQVPDGVVPVFLSTATQQIFNVIGDTDVTSDNPYKLIQKDQLLQDIQLRAAVSDFQPLKQKILIYPSDELLLVYDYEFKYEQNFYLCVTEEAKELVLNPPKDEAKEEGEEGGEDEFNEPIPTTPIPQEWIPLGSDKEINETLVTHSRPLLKYMVSKKRRYFANECQFYDYSSSHRENYIEVTSAPPPSEEIKEIHKMEIETGVQAVPEVADKINQSKWCHPVNASTQYQSRTFIDDEANEEWNSELMNEFLNKVTPRVELCLQQNEIIDIFPDDYMQLAEDDGIVADKSDTNLKEYQSFTDLKFSKDKVVTCIDWHPTIKGIIAVSCGEPYCLNERIELSFKLMHSNSLVIIWSFTDPIHPQLFLEAPEDILCFKFNPSNPNLIAGGCINGQVYRFISSTACIILSYRLSFGTSLNIKIG